MVATVDLLKGQRPQRRRTQHERERCADAPARQPAQSPAPRPAPRKHPGCRQGQYRVDRVEVAHGLEHECAEDQEVQPAPGQRQRQRMRPPAPPHRSRQAERRQRRQAERGARAPADDLFQRIEPGGGPRPLDAGRPVLGARLDGLLLGQRIGERGRQPPVPRPRIGERIGLEQPKRQRGERAECAQMRQP